jgi:hypothetical protein
MASLKQRMYFRVNFGASEDMRDDWKLKRELKKKNRNQIREVSQVNLPRQHQGLTDVNPPRGPHLVHLLASNVTRRTWKARAWPNNPFHSPWSRRVVSDERSKQHTRCAGRLCYMSAVVLSAPKKGIRRAYSRPASHATRLLRARTIMAWRRALFSLFHFFFFFLNVDQFSSNSSHNLSLDKGELQFFICSGTTLDMFNPVSHLACILRCSTHASHSTTTLKTLKLEELRRNMERRKRTSSHLLSFYAGNQQTAHCCWIK